MIDWFVSYTVYDADFNAQKHGTVIKKFSSSMTASEVLAKIDGQLCSELDISPDYLQYNAFNKV